MNRLIILGNGFDLAHGLKTSYSDFMLDLLKNVVVDSFYKSEVDEYREIYTYPMATIKVIRKGRRRIDAAVETRLCSIEDFAVFYKFLKEFNIEITTNWKESIFGKTYKHLRKYSWADIEAIYYDTLVDIIEKNRGRKLEEKYKAEVTTLNQELDFFRNRLSEYLERIQIKPTKYTSGARFWGKIKDKDESGNYPSSIQILNFNYTDTIKNYGSHDYAFGDSNSQVDINPIHGSLDEPDSIIFGYGDEVDIYYKKMEDLNEIELLRHAKSFGYFKNDRYRRFSNFLALGKYEVWVVGHSCGLSDRVMLKKIFEHQNCEFIKLFHYQKEDSNDHFEKTQEISRHFSNKELMREKIVFFQEEDSINDLCIE